MASKVTENVRRYVLLPNRGLHSDALRGIGPAQPEFAQALAERVAVLGAKKPKAALKIVHSSAATGPKLVELNDVEAAALKASNAGIKLVPLVLYEVMRAPREEILEEAGAKAAKANKATKAAKAAPKAALTIRIVNAATLKPVKGAVVVAFTDFDKRTGAQGTTNAKGQVALKFTTTSKQLDLLLVYGPAGYWGLCERAVRIKNGEDKSIAPVDLAVTDYAETLYGGHPASAGKGVTVGVIDTGVDGKHPDLTVAGGAVFVADEKDAGDPGPAAQEGEHGTHVAGIIAGHGSAPTGKKGVAPAVRLFSYRVFPNAGGGASNYDILRAIEQGVKDGCDVLNMSLGGAEPDEAVHDAIKAAFDQGTLCFAAAGNSGRHAVGYPAAWTESVAVSAAGKQGTFPANSAEALDIAPPPATSDNSVFIAGFSDVGPQIDVTGPGVGIVSTLPNAAYGVMSGTSMACPAAVGAAAALLAAHPDVLAMPRGRDRTTAMLAIINAAAQPLGFPKELEGLGMLP